MVVVVVVVARAETARVLLAVTVPWVCTVGVVLPPLVHSCRSDRVTGMQEPGVVEPSVEELCVQDTINFQ
jgi:hypothetical protein